MVNKLSDGSNIKELVEFLVMNLVDNPNEVKVEQMDTDDSIVVEVSVAKDDMGKVIGKHGRIARAIRIITKALATREGKKVMVEIVE